MPKDALAWIDKARNVALYGRGFVGVDIGSSSTKIVQLSIQDGLVSLDTYGMISNSNYSHVEDGQASFPTVDAASAEVADLMHEIGVLSRRGAVAVPFAESLMQAVELPKRDPEQMKRIIPVESQKYIPIPVNEILLDWYVIPDEESNAFDATKPRSTTEIHMEKVMLVGLNKTTASKFIAIASRSGLTPEFYEIEAFSALRASLHAKKSPTLVMDFGASSTKIYVVDQHWIMFGARIIPTGGDAITQEIRKKTPMQFAEAEKMKQNMV
jgi:type IV pilus assembly protein PilM